MATGKLRATPPTKLGPPNVPAAPRVSTKRQGVMAIKTNEFGGAAADEEVVAAASGSAAAARASAWVGCQKSGAGQCFNGATFEPRVTWAVSASGMRMNMSEIRVRVVFILNALLRNGPFPVA